ncbi:sensor domain-containing phosphodiesterase [Undibacterium umbellatum]|jgi:diguanylate cyclase (GGDEF)-like protein/PAS domain S-box-containing protein|uniref:EAL domain-containing protein n=1 Tax=Undibacterium umbellatum TaxID=2762300 RepID=A0ABR6ZH36_9BURK|nr:EAL domain-containing protein [Undibacterium umbellatum]MBC3911044.1 EAL domain-containing protein [Undibacterium umbellatum]
MTSQNSLSIYARSFWLTLVVFAVFTLVFGWYVYSEKQVDRRNELRFESHALSMELQESSDDLTRMVRAYVVTADPVYKSYYQQILDVRNGKAARAALGKNLFWDLVPASLPRSSETVVHAGLHIPLMDLIRKTGISQEELDLLERAKKNSDALTAIEYQAIALIEKPGLDVKAAREQASHLLYDEQYRTAKLAILRPIAEARDLMEKRGIALVEQAAQFAMRVRVLFILLGILLVGLLWRAYRSLNMSLGGSIREVSSTLINLGKGNFASPVKVKPGMDESIMGWLAVTQAKLADIEDQRHQAAKKSERLSKLYNALSQCNQSILRLENKDDLLPRICEDAVTIGGLKMAWIGLVAEGTQVLQPVASFGAGSSYLDGLYISVNPADVTARGPSAHAYLNNQPYWCQDFLHDARTAPWHERGAAQGWRASAALPLLKNGKVVGTFNLYAGHENAFDEAAQDLLTEFSIDVSHVLNRFELEDARLHALQMEELRSFMLERITASITQKELFLDVVLKVESLLPDCLCSIMMLDRDGRHLRTGAAPSLPEAFSMAIEGVVIGEGVGSCGNTLFTGERTIATDLSTHAYWHDYWRLAEQAGLRSCWSEPIRSAERKVIGAFAIYHHQPSVPDLFSLNLLEMAANLIAIGMERKQSEENLHKLSQAVEQSSNAIVITDTDIKIEYANEAYLKNAGKQLAEVLGHRPSIMRTGKTSPQVYADMWAQLGRGESWKGELINRYADGLEHTDLAHISPIRNAQGVVTHFLSIQEDISDKKRTEERIKYLAHYDALTGLPNRTLLDELARYALSLAERNQDALAVIFFDLDHFKDINDTLGHSLGDVLLVELSRRMVAAIRENDTISRLGGDEFILLLTGVDQHTVEQVVQKLMQVVNAPFHLGEYDLNVTASMGIAIYPNDGKDLETLSRNADAAMYRAKREGRNSYRFFTQEMQERSTRHLELVNALRQALEKQQFQLHFQPQIAMQTGAVLGAEALLRWQHPVLGNVSPAEFIPVAEDSGLILPIGEWVLRTAVAQWKQWQKDGLQNLLIAVNLSAVQFRHYDLPALVTRILQEADMPPACLELELTEGVAMHDPQGAIAVMNNLHERGIRMSIDDFGTGYSSLSYLKQFKVYKLKIDQSFVRDINSDPEDRAIVSAVISMAKSLGLMTIAEGVETAEQLEFLREHHCDEVQGYYYSRPLPASQFADFVRNSLCVN